MNRRKELAKFFSGFAVHELISHIFLAGSGLLPFTVFGITVTPEYNVFIVVGWFMASLALVHYAWFKHS